MSDPLPKPWLTIIGLGEDGLQSLSGASRDALDDAEVIFGGERHLALVEAGTRGRPWPIPFDIAPLLERRGTPTVMLASGDPFWNGAGGTVARHLSPSEWLCHSAPSIFSLAAARLGLRLETCRCMALHAAPFETLRPVLAPGQTVLATLRDPAAVGKLDEWLTAQGFDAELLVLHALGGPREAIFKQGSPNPPQLQGPVAAAATPRSGPFLQRASGLPNSLFAHDGQITKQQVRALTLSALAPRMGERLWDIGAGSGSISVEWCLSGGTAAAIEPRADRIPNIRTNAQAFGLAHLLTVHHGAAPEALAVLPAPDAVFVGGGGSDRLFEVLFQTLAPGTRLVANGVTLETEARLAALYAAHGGDLTRIELASAEPLGSLHGWKPARPIVQWSVTL
ncbi:precorrin-6Y C5,15-methyltransferase (decarboxylating) subunit CbiT [Alphaproteobacteria bacterium KMM 3653]|uniref:Precorrin-6Y C5,15-methyltransferase (Decarboxylating) subunit CbiT n=1 Tax=Harenicola maris TaxID=2841044 RepID=A0AAP2CLF3_9RHOB|nr:precorrin-6Y C5,15-methyltransferase (decarboxylating) subunit CbiT [Harenicola maris]